LRYPQKLVDKFVDYPCIATSTAANRAPKSVAVKN
jgi:hypothetical protein